MASLIWNGTISHISQMVTCYLSILFQILLSQCLLIKIGFNQIMLVKYSEYTDICMINLPCKVHLNICFLS